MCRATTIRAKENGCFASPHTKGDHRPWTNFFGDKQVTSRRCRLYTRKKMRSSEHWALLLIISLFFFPDYVELIFPFLDALGASERLFHKYLYLFHEKAQLGCVCRITDDLYNSIYLNCIINQTIGCFFDSILKDMHFLFDFVNAELKTFKKYK
jgi:hypothetical protein